MNEFKLDNAPKIPSGFKAPERYFDTLSQKVTQRLEEKPVIHLNTRNRNTIYAAAAALVLALMIPLYNAVNNTPTELDESTLENYLAYQSGISQYDLMTMLEAEEIDEMEIEIQIDDSYIEDVLSTNTNFEQLITE